jgi:DNA-binding NtrC family response regulator
MRCSNWRCGPADLVLVYLRMPGVTGLEVLRAIRDVSSQCRVVLMSGHATIDSAVMAVKLDAMDYLTKPFDLQRLRQLLASVHTDLEDRRALLGIEGDAARHIEFCGMIYRLNIAEIVLPLLRDRREDIPYLTAAFVRQCTERFGKALSGLTPGAERKLAGASWDGNVRQLRNVLERACMLAAGEFISNVTVCRGGRANVADHVLSLGADDYIMKPFEPAVLTARVKAAFSRQRLAA